MAERYPEALTSKVLLTQRRWRWFASAIQIKHGVPYVLMIEADIGYLILVPNKADSAFEFGLDTIDALLEALDIHPEVHDQPHDALFSFDQNPERIQWVTGGADDLALQRRLKDAAQQLASMSPAQGRKTLSALNRQSLPLAVGDTVPNDVMQQRLAHYADLWLRHAEGTNLFRQLWNVWRKKKPWLDEVVSTVSRRY